MYFGRSNLYHGPHSWQLLFQCCVCILYQHRPRTGTYPSTYADACPDTCQDACLALPYGHGIRSTESGIPLVAEQSARQDETSLGYCDLSGLQAAAPKESGRRSTVLDGLDRLDGLDGLDQHSSTRVTAIGTGTISGVTWTDPTCHSKKLYPASRVPRA
jgi:hypothetical protein